MKQFVTVVYDISNDRRRTRLHKALLDFGTPVQYSVFECWLTPDAVQRLQARVDKIIKPQKDHVRYYFLCAACVSKIQTTRAGEVSRPPEVMVV
jgi:CRISPR-associated protein Cas2